MSAADGRPTAAETGARSEQDAPAPLTLEVGYNAECQTLSRLLANDADADAVYARLTGADFGDVLHRLVYLRCKEYRQAGKRIEPALVADALAADGSLPAGEAAALVAELSTFDAAPGHARDFADMVKMASILRALREFGKELSGIEVSPAGFDDAMAVSERRMSEIVHGRITGDIAPISVYANEYYGKLNAALADGGTLTGVPTGFKDIDRLTNGFQPGDLIVLAARPGKGKTAFAVNVLMNAAWSLGKLDAAGNMAFPADEAVVMFSLEMGAEQIVHRMVTSATRKNFSLAALGSLRDRDEEVNDVLNEIYRVRELPIALYDGSNITVEEIHGRLKSMAATKAIRLVVVDYLQLVGAAKTHGRMDRQQEVTIVSHGLKAIARDLRTPVLALAQLSRKIEERRGADAEPILSDLRESGSIEQDADLVCFLHSPRQATFGDGDAPVPNADHSEEIDFIVAKHRNGPTGRAALTFQKAYGKIMDRNIPQGFSEDAYGDR